MTVITAITSQNTSSYAATHALPVDVVRDQLDSVFEDFEISAVKVGMLYNTSLVRAVAAAIKDVHVPIVVDPVIISTTHGTLLRRSAIGAFCSRILPLASVVTPNRAEARTISSASGIEAGARSMMRNGAKSVIMTGIRYRRSICDYVFAPKKTVIRTATPEFASSHGGGCAHSAAVAFAMARGHHVVHAARFARRFAEAQIAGSMRPGRGIPVTGTRDAAYVSKLRMAIASFCAIPRACDLIPECQSNFVLAPPGASLPAEILGVRGRITRAGARVVVAGGIAHGGSRHVAAALTSMRKRFPEVSSCANVKRTPRVLAALRRAGMRVASYDRADEPRAISRREGGTMEWGVASAVARLDRAPDAIQNPGGHGKEPMVLVFGRDAADVANKVRKISASAFLTST